MHRSFLTYRLDQSLVCLFVSFCGITSFLGALLWQRFGAEPCVLCLVERRIILLAGLVALPGVLIRWSFVPTSLPQYCLALSGFLWAAVSGVLFYHLGIQKHWFNVPSLCRSTSLPLEDSIETIETFLTQKAQSACDAVEFTFLGHPPTFYFMLFCIFLLFVCFHFMIKKRNDPPS